MFRRSMPARGVSFARYLRNVHIEWCPFKTRAVAPIFFLEMHTRKIKEAVPKLNISKSLLPSPPAGGDDAAAFIDRTRLTFVDGSEKVIAFDGHTIRDILEEIDEENVRILHEERKRGKPF